MRGAGKKLDWLRRVADCGAGLGLLTHALIELYGRVRPHPMPASLYSGRVVCLMLFASILKRAFHIP